MPSCHANFLHMLLLGNLSNGTVSEISAATNLSTLSHRPSPPSPSPHPCNQNHAPHSFLFTLLTFGLFVWMSTQYMLLLKTSREKKKKNELHEEAHISVELEGAQECLTKKVFSALRLWRNIAQTCLHFQCITVLVLHRRLVQWLIVFQVRD